MYIISHAIAFIAGLFFYHMVFCLIYSLARNRNPLVVKAVEKIDQFQLRKEIQQAEIIDPVNSVEMKTRYKTATTIDELFDQ